MHCAINPPAAVTNTNVERLSVSATFKFSIGFRMITWEKVPPQRRQCEEAIVQLMTFFVGSVCLVLLVAWQTRALSMARLVCEKWSRPRGCKHGLGVLEQKLAAGAGPAPSASPIKMM